MPRSNRPRGRRVPGGAEEPEEVDLTRALVGRGQLVTRRGLTFNVQPVGASNSVKIYTCPGCSGEIAPGTPHVVVWRADGIMGEADDVAARRHWHTHCWKIG